ncbi:MAG: TRIC cation channel family protein, partial [Rhodovarius sp.]|nr:TRIC cation channel family protein [Rhodovarius sp.]
TFGGILRDVICNQVPLILRKEIYALAALAGAALFILLCEAEVRRDVAIPAGMALAFAIRAAAIRFGWSLPPYRGPA